jgi:glycosyltransferase involved in cell wall biosynthesis
MSPDAADCFQQLARQIKECTTAKIEPPAVQKLSTNQHKNHQQNRRRIITVANGHPNFLKGGAEVAAHALHNAWLNAGHDATFIARRPVGENVTGGLTQYNEHEFLFEASVGDPFLLTSSAPSSLVRSIKDLVLKLQPEFIHFHHYSCSGLELFPLFRNLCPNAKIALSLHEYLLICNNHGQFIRTAAGAASTGTVTNTIRTVSLCENASPAECQKCFPTRSAGEFLLRKLYFQNMLRNVDFFISPSDFLKERFVRWGLPAEKIHVIENGLSPVFLNTCRTERLNYPPATPVVFSYFGQINEFKGADLLLEAFTMLPAEIRKNVRLNIHASGLENQRHEYKSKIEKLLHEIQDVAEFFGQYSTADVPRLMAKTHYVVMASIWWENSPVVIQEAFSMGRPVICADIGGMKEKVINEKNGLHFSAGNVSSLRDVLVRAASDSHLIKYLSQNCKLALSSEATGAQILSLL